MLPIGASSGQEKLFHMASGALMSMKPPYQTVINFKTEANSAESAVYLKLHLHTPAAVEGGTPLVMSSQPLVLSIPMAHALVESLARQLAVLQSAKVPPPTTPDQHH